MLNTANFPQSRLKQILADIGGDTDTTDLAHWYKSAPDICIFLKPIP